LHFSCFDADIYELENGDIISPWTNSNKEEAPELLDVPDPCSFREVLDSMDQSEENKLADFAAAIPIHVSAELLASTNIETLLLSKYKSVFVPDNWRGIQHIEPLHIETLSTLSLSLKPKARPVNPALYANAKLEFDRLKGYFYIDSVSPYASCLVIEPKKTPPYIRICGDYRVINQHIRSTHAPIPNVLNEIMRIAKYRVFVDLDMTNSFHQIPLDSHSQLLLSIQTIWGQIQPLFLPEGVKPASGALQDIVRYMFGHL
jgi:hypothetical protein